MNTSQRSARISLALIMLSGVLGGCMPGLMLADFGPPLTLRFLLAALPYIVIPLAIGWLTPSLWWAAGVAALSPLVLAIMSVMTSPSQTLEMLLARWPLVMPMLLTLSFALLGRFFRQRRLPRQPPLLEHSEHPDQPGP